jgi:hypothetical protein
VLLAKEAWRPVSNPEPSPKAATPPRTGGGKAPTGTGSASSVALKPKSQVKSFGTLGGASTPPAAGGGGRGAFELEKRLVIERRVPQTPVTPAPLALDALTPASPAKPSSLGSPPQPSSELSAHASRSPASATSLSWAPVSEHCPVMSAACAAQGYTVHPPLDALGRMGDAELERVQDFSVARKGYGCVKWLGAVDVRGLDVDRDVEILAQAITVYRSEEDTPPRGTRLNRPALLSLEDMAPPEDFDLPDFAAWLRDEYASELGVTHVDYDADTRVWVFRTEHFTRYAFDKSHTPRRPVAEEPPEAGQGGLLPQRERAGG